MKKWEMLGLTPSNVRSLHLKNNEGRYLAMMKQLQSLRAEIKAINLWDRLYLDSPHTDIESDAFVLRQIRRKEILQQLADMSSPN